jgi:ATP-binding protein involved in chromosome partitioning
VPTTEQVLEALATVIDPEIGKPITDLGMVADIAVEGRTVAVAIKLTVAGCPLKDRITNDVTAAVKGLGGVDDVRIAFGSMTDTERADLSTRLRAERGQGEERTIEFAQPGNTTNVIAIASGKGGVGKSSITVNLAAALAADGHQVGVLDADIYGYSVPRMLGVSGQPVGVAGMVMPLQAHGMKVISIGFFLPDPDRPVMWRGPMLHRALQQFLADVYWGDLDYLLCDLPPGTGDVAISLAQMLPNADLIVVTTPQQAAQKVAVRAGLMAEQTGMKVTGIIENMASFTCPDCGSSHDIFGSGGGQELAEALSVPLLGRVPIDPRLRVGSDVGMPLVLSAPDVPASQALKSIADGIVKRARSVVGRSLPLSVG